MTASTKDSGGNNGKPENLIAHQFKPGESGNPGGRPKKRPVTEYLLEQLESAIPQSMLDAMKDGPRAVFLEIYGPNPTFGQMIAFKLVQMCAKGDVFAMRELMDRVEGKVTQKMNVAGEEGGPIIFKVTRVGCQGCEDGIH